MIRDQNDNAYVETKTVDQLKVDKLYYFHT